ncbi:hypothetical protein ACFDR9_004050, partial [Janthinobacterium sp. CG_23.3]
PDRQLVIKLVEEAVVAKCTRGSACEALGISQRTYQRWLLEAGSGQGDGRKGSRRVAPANKLSEDERQQILLVAEPRTKSARGTKKSSMTKRDIFVDNYRYWHSSLKMRV